MTILRGQGVEMVPTLGEPFDPEGSATLATRLPIQGILAALSDEQVEAGFRFDVPVRFAQDTLSVSRATFAAGDVVPVDLFPRLGADSFVPDPRPVLGAEQVKGDVPVLGGGVEAAGLENDVVDLGHVRRAVRLHPARAPRPDGPGAP